jgi:colanic acid/amylovoran biosynthesis glycosyltransferase
MSKRTIAVITASYPYLPGEQFLEAEAPYWPTASFENVFVLPRNTEGKPRPLPRGITLDHALRQPSRAIRLAYLAPALLSPVYFKEVRSLLAAKRFSIQRALNALFATRNTVLGAAQFASFCKRKGRVDIVYCYWNDTMAYACCLAKQRRWCRRVVSRAHRGDLYEERSPGNYMPLKRQFVAAFDRTFLLSRESLEYFVERYGGCPAQLAIAPLGVTIPTQTARLSPPGQLHILSVSFCVPVKRIDRIIAAIAHFAATIPQLSIRWTHIGAGTLFEELQSAAAISLGPLPNVTFAFLGQQPNAAVRQFYEEHEVDLFINTSASEGIPVSIMEAMSYGVPTIAPDIGGVSDLVNPANGVLLSDKPNITEVAAGLSALAQRARNQEIRQAARNRVTEHFNAQNNYPIFLNLLDEIARTGESPGNQPSVHSKELLP